VSFLDSKTPKSRHPLAHRAPGLPEGRSVVASRLRPAWGVLFLTMAVLLAVWTTWLTIRLPTHHLVRSWDVAWGGFDVLLTSAFVATGIALIRRSSWARAWALATAALLVVDAWFDVTTAQSGEQLLQAILQAALIELPVAALCLYLAWRFDRERRRDLG
jgi:hypothetical protein